MIENQNLRYHTDSNDVNFNPDSRENFVDFDPKFGTGTHCRQGFIDAKLIVLDIGYLLEKSSEK